MDQQTYGPTNQHVESQARDKLITPCSFCHPVSTSPNFKYQKYTQIALGTFSFTRRRFRVHTHTHQKEKVH